MGYSVVAEFVVQHEDSVSIAEALGILKNRWDDDGIAIGNLMIDCQQSEENAIRGVFLNHVYIFVVSIACRPGSDGL